jgi:hypothetical protein
MFSSLHFLRLFRLQILPPSSGFKGTSALKIQVVMFFQNLGTHLLDYQTLRRSGRPQYESLSLWRPHVLHWTCSALSQLLRQEVTFPEWVTPPSIIKALLLSGPQGDNQWIGCSIMCAARAVCIISEKQLLFLSSDEFKEEWDHGFVHHLQNATAFGR